MRGAADIFVFQILLPLVSPVLDLLFLGSLVLWGLAGLHITQIPHLWTTEDVQRSVVFFLGFLLIDVLTCVVAFALERHEDWTLLIPVLLQRFYYRQLMYIVLFPLGEGSGEWAAGGMEGRGEGTAGDGAGDAVAR